MTRREALEILGLNPETSLDEVRNAYRKLARIYHPDKNSAPNATAMFRIIHDAYEFILNNDVRQQAETEARRRQAEEETARKRAEEELARRYAEAEIQRKRTEEARHRTKEEAAQKAKKKAEWKTEWKDIRNLYIALLPINLVLYLTTLRSMKVFFNEIDLFSALLWIIYFILGTSINSFALYEEFWRLTNYLIDPTRFDTDRVKPYEKQFIVLYAIYTIVYAIYSWQLDGSLLFVINSFLTVPVLGWFAIRIAGSIILIPARFLKWFVQTIRGRK